MNRRPNPFAAVESRTQARVMAGYSVAGFGLWGLILLMQAGLIWYGFGSEPEEYRGGTTGFAVFQALIAGVAALVQWRKPNRIMSVFGLAWSLYEVSSLMVGLMVGMPMAMGGLPNWAAALTAGGMLVCAVLHIGGLRGAIHMQRADFPA